MIIGLLCIALLVAVFSLLIKKLVDADRHIARNFGTLSPKEYYQYTVEILQFLHNGENEEKLAQFFRPSTNIEDILDWIIFSNNGVHKIILDELEEQEEQEYGKEIESYDAYWEYMKNQRKYTERFFNVNRGEQKYIPVHYKNTTFFTTFGQLNCYKWVIESGLYDYIIRNKDELEEILVGDGYLETISRHNSDNDDAENNENSDNADNDDNADNADNADNDVSEDAISDLSEDAISDLSEDVISDVDLIKISNDDIISDKLRNELEYLRIKGKGIKRD